jgi:hypothetical protein
MPGRILFDWLPFYSSMRSYARFGVLAVLAMAVLLGLGWTSIHRYGGKWVGEHGRWLIVPAMCLLLADLWTAPYRWGSSRVAPTETSKYLASAQPGSVMQMPPSGSRFAPAQAGPGLYWGVYYGKPITYGWDSYDPSHWRAAQRALADFPDSQALDILREWNVRYIVVSQNAYAQHWQEMDDRLRDTGALKYLAEFQEPRSWDVDPAVLDAYPGLESYVFSDTQMVFELLP